MFSFFRNHWRHLTKGFISVGISSFLLLAISTNIVLFNGADYGTEVVYIKTPSAKHRLNVDVANTPEEHANGLMEVEALPEDEGMLFAYTKPHLVAFWMKNMLIPLDLLFIGEDLKIKHIEYEASPCFVNTVCPRYIPPTPVRYVLEVSGGYAKAHRVSVGDRLILEKPL